MPERTKVSQHPSESRQIVIPDSLPPHLLEPVSYYVQRARSFSVDPHRVLLCAALLVAAERSPECHLPAGPRFRR
jgi:hypothetical protein